LVRTGSGRGAKTRARTWLTVRARLGPALLIAATALTGLPSVALATPDKVRVELRAADAPVGELNQTDAVPLPGGATVYRFQQEVSGVKVLNGQAVVNDPSGTAPDLVADSTKPRIERPPEAAVARPDAIAIAFRNVGVERLRGRVSATLAIESGDAGTLVWRVRIPSGRPLGDFEVLIDAVSGDVVRTGDLLRDFRTGHAKLYNPNPVVQNGGSHGLGGDHRDRDTSLLTALRRPVSLRKIKGGQNCLRGKWATAKLGGDAHSVCRPSLHWKRVKRAANAFEALMVYYQITRAQQYIHDLGFSDSNGPKNGIDDRRQVAVADAFKADNSFYSPFTRRIKYGSGGVDDAEDADVILHEYGHAMQDDQARKFLISSDAEVGALQEGSADYWAAAMSARAPRTANEDDVCIFDWDAASYGDRFRAAPPYSSGRFCGRRADDPRTLTQAENTNPCSFDIHYVGQVWSSALWRLRKQIGGQAMDRIYLASQFMYVAHEQFDQAAQHLLDADVDLTGGANQAVICAEMEANRGLKVAGCP
jgi:Fungalysin/Thermolysin Propeptide Motif